jgi:hypothetical protein
MTPPSPFVSSEAVVGMAVYTAKAMPHGKGPRRLGNAGGEHPLIELDQTSAFQTL